MAFLSALLLDIHPIAIYLVAGIDIIIFFRNLKKILYFMAGGLLGLLVITGLNYIFNGTLGIFGFFKDSSAFLGDHYFPVFYDPLPVILTRPFVKLKYYLVYMFFGALFIYVGIYYRFIAGKIKERAEWFILLINAIIFFFLSNLFSEGGNGYALYSLVAYLPLFILLYNEILSKATANAKRIFIALLFIIPVFAIYRNAPRIGQWVKNNSYFHAHYRNINNYINDGEKLLIRPTFSFALSKRKVYCEPLYPVLVYMYKNKLSFQCAISAKGFDIVAVDEKFLEDADLKTPIDKYSNGSFYQAIKQVKFDTKIVSELAARKIFVPVYEFEDFYHGHTVFYRVDKELLKKYCEENP